MAETFFREALLEAATPELSEAGLARLSFCSELPVLRVDKKRGKYWEILSLAPGDCNLALLNRQGVVLQDHDETMEIGEVVKDSARVEADGKARATIHITDIHWKNRAAAGKADSVSVGYRLLSELSREVGEDGIKKIRFSFAPYEISLLTGPPADDTVGIGRSKTSMQKSLVDIIREQAEPADGPFSRAACRSYDFMSVLQRQASNRAALPKERTLEYDLHREMERNAGMINSGTFVPFAALLPNTRAGRDMQATVFGGGGAAVISEWQPATELLYTHTCIIPSGATVISGLRGNFIKPRVTAGLTSNSVPEIGPATPSGLTLDQGALTPRRVTIQVPVSLELLMQTGGVAEELIKANIRKQFGVVIDQLALFGLGYNSQPLGLLNTPGIGTVTFGGAADFPHLCLFEENLSLLNADDPDKCGWIVSVKTRNKWKQTSRIAATNYPSMLLENGRACDYPVCTTNQLAGQDQAILANWPDFLVLLWYQGVDITLDSVTQAGIGEAIITAHIWLNVLPQHPAAYCVSSDSAAL